MELKCKKCNGKLELIDIYDSDGGVDEGYIVEKRYYECEKCKQGYYVGTNVTIPDVTEKDIIWFKESED